MRRAAGDVAELVSVNQAGSWKPEWDSLDAHPMAGWFEDAKLGIFLDWGPWSVAGWAPLEGTTGTGGSYPDWYEFLMGNYYKAYHAETWGSDFRRDDLLPLLTGEAFDADWYAALAVDAGAKYLVPFARHHAGWTMWESQYTKRNAVEMGPHRDIYKELAVACREQDLKLGLYFSISEWEYPAILDRPINGWDARTGHLGTWRNELTFTNWRPAASSFYSEEMNGLASGKIAVRDYFADYLVPLFKEAVDTFDPDLVWWDGGWNTTTDLNRTREMSAYFYNSAEGRKSVVINDRAGISPTRQHAAPGGGREADQPVLQSAPHGDFATREYNSGQGESTERKWEICRSISPAFGYNWQDTDESCLSSEELITMLVRIVAENGNLLLVIGPDASGRLPAFQEARLRDLGAWLRRNGEGIYGTRTWEVARDGDTFFTRSKDGRLVYVFRMSDAHGTVRVKSISPLPGSEIRILGSEIAVPWRADGDGIEVTIPAGEPSADPAAFGIVMRVQVEAP